MSGMKQYLNSFRVNAGLDPDDRVLSEAEDTNEMERVLMAALENAAKSKGRDNWSNQTAKWTEGRDSGDPESRRYSEWEVECSVVLPLAAARPNVIRRKDGNFAVVVYLFASPKGAGKIERNMGAFTAASKKGLSKRALEEGVRGPWWGVGPSMEPPDDSGDDDYEEFEYGQNDLSSDGEEAITQLLDEEILSETIPSIIEKAFPSMQLDFAGDFERSGGAEPNHYGWFLGTLVPKK